MASLPLLYFTFTHRPRFIVILIYCYSLVCLLYHKCQFLVLNTGCMHISFDCVCCLPSPPIQVYCHSDKLERLLMSRCYTLVCLLNCQHGLLHQPILLIYQHLVYQKFCSWMVSSGCFTLWHFPGGWPGVPSLTLSIYSVFDTFLAILKSGSDSV